MDATLTSKAQITLPKDLRTLLQLKPGDKVAFVPQPDGQVVVRKATMPSFAALRGVLPAPARAFTLDEIDAAVADAAATRQIPAP